MGTYQQITNLTNRYFRNKILIKGSPEIHKEFFFLINTIVVQFNNLNIVN